jgi:hypothetical protein
MLVVKDHPPGTLLPGHSGTLPFVRYHVKQNRRRENDRTSRNHGVSGQITVHLCHGERRPNKRGGASALGRVEPSRECFLHHADSGSSLPKCALHQWGTGPLTWADQSRSLGPFDCREPGRCAVVVVSRLDPVWFDGGDIPSTAGVECRSHLFLSDGVRTVWLYSSSRIHLFTGWGRQLSLPHPCSTLLNQKAI